MSNQDLLRSVRPLYLLVTKPNQSEFDSKKYWSMKLNGLHPDHIKESARQLRTEKLENESPDSLKATKLQKNLAIALGSKNFDIWSQSSDGLIDFMAKHDLTKPSDLITWSNPPSEGSAISARQLSDRLFNSDLTLPKKIFTGVGCSLYEINNYGRADIDTLSGFDTIGDESRLNWCIKNFDKTFTLKNVYTNRFELQYVTGKDLILHAFRHDYISNAFNLLGDNLLLPNANDPELTIYKQSEKQLKFTRKIIQYFRDAIELSTDGWVEVIPYNENIIFLKGRNGNFDWVIRDQRDEKYLGNQFFPIFKADELPSAMKQSALKTHLYYETGIWLEKLEHDAEHHHYNNGGTIETWPGYEKLIENKLISNDSYKLPKQRTYRPEAGFVAHRINNYCLMISELITIKQFLEFYDSSTWQNIRSERKTFRNKILEPDLYSVNCNECSDELPVSVTWFDAVAYCKFYEEKTKLPVRLLQVEEWKQISPKPLRDIHNNGWGDGILKWGVYGGDGVIGSESSHREVINTADDTYMKFNKNLDWARNSNGLNFLNIVDFGEWLGDYQNGRAPAANSATGLSLMTGPLDREYLPANLTMRYEGLKVGFRLCYVANSDA